MRPRPLIAVADVEASSRWYQRLLGMAAEVVKPPHRNPPSGDGGPNHRECWLRDPDGYIVLLASPDGEGSSS